MSSRPQDEATIAPSDEEHAGTGRAAGAALGSQPAAKDTGELEVGSSVGPFRIEAKLGQGGMGVVYRATDERLRRAVALKLLPKDFAADANRKQRFLREARSAASLVHPNVATVFEAGEVDGRIFLAMELIEGETLRARIGGRPLPVDEARRIALAIARGLAKAHKAGIVHRDLKPDNVMLTSEGDVKILDFGLAKRVDRAASSADDGASVLTVEGGVMGTPGYMSPEQARGQGVDARTDVFAFGAILYEMLTGTRAFTGPSAADVIAAVLTTAPPLVTARNPSVGADLAGIVERCLAREASRRPRDGDELAIALARLADDRVSVGNEPTMLADAVGGAVPRGRRRAIVLAVSGAIAVGGLAFVLAPARARFGSAPASSASAAPLASRPRAMLDVPPPKTSVPEAAAAYRAGLQAWRDGNGESTSRQLFARASQLDATLAEAHVRAAYTSFRWMPADARQLLAKAMQLRSQLDEHDQLVLEAIVPLLAEPSDLVEHEKRVRAALSRFPDDEELLSMLLSSAVIRYDFAREMDLADEVVSKFPANGQAAWIRGASRTWIGKPDESRRLLEEATRSLPGCGGCRWRTAELDEFEGKCAEALAMSRAWTTIEPTDPMPYWFEAKAQVALGSLDAAREVLAQRWAYAPEAGRRVVELGDRAALAVLNGDLAEAEHRAREMYEAVSGAPTLAQHRGAALLLGDILEETGQVKQAAEVASSVLARQGAWASSVVYAPVFDWTTPLLGFVFRAGGTTRDDLRARRARETKNGLAWFLDRGSPRDSWAFRTWMWTWAYESETADEANDAIAGLGGFLPIVAINARERVLYARTLAAAGKWDEARPQLEAVARQCNALDLPVQFVRAIEQLGESREHANDVAGACDAYAQVTARWSAATKSITAERARKHAAALGCARRH